MEERLMNILLGLEQRTCSSLEQRLTAQLAEHRLEVIAHLELLLSERVFGQSLSLSLSEGTQKRLLSLGAKRCGVSGVHASASRRPGVPHGNEEASVSTTAVSATPPSQPPHGALTAVEALTAPSAPAAPATPRGGDEPPEGTVPPQPPLAPPAPANIDFAAASQGVRVAAGLARDLVAHLGNQPGVPEVEKLWTAEDMLVAD